MNIKNLKNAIYPIAVLILIGFLLLFERMGIGYTASGQSLSFLSQSEMSGKKDFSKAEKVCLIITDSDDIYADKYLSQLKFILESVWVGYDVADISQRGLPQLSEYKTVVSVLDDIDSLDEDVLTLLEWVKGGGRMLFLAPLAPSTIVSAIAPKLGISEYSFNYVANTGIRILTDFMIGAKGFEYKWVNYTIDSLNMGVSGNVTIHAESIEGYPMLWETEYGKGRFVINNLASFDKPMRGMMLSAYSLLEDSFAYPVINASAFFIDDFPSPIPTGYNEYITRDYKRDIESFYNNIWWPDMLNLAQMYGLKYTGLLIETYEDSVTAPFKRNSDATRYSYFGNLIVALGGEIGYHGYNHQPLCLDGFDFVDDLGYKTWPSVEQMSKGFDELVDFCSDIFPETDFTTYVPPSNILSDEGRQMLAENYPHIKTISGIYSKIHNEYEQEFDIDKYGHVNFPRVISGTMLDSYSKWMAISELNYHFINSHFFHPDDVLDPERGAEYGWEKMYSDFSEYVGWLYKSAPPINNCSAADAAKATQRYDVLSFESSEKNSVMSIDIDNFHDRAYFLIRIRGGEAYEVDGGSVEKLTGELYLLRADTDRVYISIER